MTPAPPPDATRLGILSDTHGRAEACAIAVRTLIDLGAQALVHCGDVGGEPVLDALAGHPCWFVWGNNDLDRRRLRAYAEDLGLACLGDLGRFTFAARQFVLTHGDDIRQLDAICTAAERGQTLPGIAAPDDYLLTGHTHAPLDARFGRLRWINPGALHRARPKTVALLDVAADRLTVHEMAI